MSLIEDGAVAIADGRIAAVGRGRDLQAAFQTRDTIDAGGHAVVPGFVDPHTHLPWAGHHAVEFEMRIGGATYMQIMAAGGGIARTVADTAPRRWRSWFRRRVLASTACWPSAQQPPRPRPATAST